MLGFAKYRKKYGKVLQDIAKINNKSFFLSMQGFFVEVVTEIGTHLRLS